MLAVKPIGLFESYIVVFVLVKSIFSGLITICTVSPVYYYLFSATCLINSTYLQQTGMQKLLRYGTTRQGNTKNDWSYIAAQDVGGGRCGQWEAGEDVPMGLFQGGNEILTLLFCMPLFNKGLLASLLPFCCCCFTLCLLTYCITA